MIVCQVNSIPELMGNFNSGIAYLKKMELELINLELKFATKQNPQINLPFNFLIQKYFFHDNPTWNVNYLELVFQVVIRGRYLKYLFMVKSSR